MLTTRTDDLRVLFDVSGEWALLNHGGFGRVPRPVLEAQAARRRWVDDAPLRFFESSRRVMNREVREAVAERVGADADDLALVPNATFGLNVLAYSAASHGLATAGASLDYVGVLAMWEQLRSRGLRHESVDVDPWSAQPLGDVERGLTARPGLLVLPHVASSTTTYFDVARGRPDADVVALDGAHVPGHLDLDLSSLGVDAYVGDLHKWMCAPRGTAFLWVRPELHDWLRIPLGTVATIEAATDLGARLDWLGTSDPSAWLVIPDALETSARELVPAARAQAPLVDLAVAELAERGWPTLPTHPDLLMRTFVAPEALAADAESFAARLRGALADARVDAPVMPLGDSRVGLRLSLAWYVSAADVGRLLAVVDDVTGPRKSGALDASASVD